MKTGFFFSLFCWAHLLIAQNNNTQFVNPFIGTGGHGHTFPGATVPFGMVQVSPDTRTEGWDAASGYHYDDSTVLGFSHTHLNGTGISDFCDVLVTPSVSGSLKPLRFSHKDEIAKTGYFKTVVYDSLGEKIDVELTSSERVGFHRYRFSKNTKAIYLVINKNLRNKILAPDHLGYDAALGENQIEDSFTSDAWAKNRHLSYCFDANVPWKEIKQAKAYKYAENKTTVLLFDVSKTHELLIKVALSPVSEKNAIENMAKELPHWNFEKVRQEAEQKWAKYLNRIQIEGTDEQKTIFYTALYHTMIHPSIWQDVNGDYRGLDNNVHNAKSFAYHSIFSLWDTYRGAHPLYTIVCPEKVSDFVNSFIDDFGKTKHLPMWNFPGSETWCMIGNHAIPVIADAYLKGIKGFDAEKALNAMVATANRDSLGLNAYKKHGYIPADTEGESVSKTLEYAYDDYCIAQMAKAMGKNDIYETFIRRSQNWKNQFNPKTGFFQAKMNETFVEPFEPREVNFHFTEGNAWQYAFAVQHDIEGLIETLGGKAAFEAKLDAFFSADSKTTGRDQADITGLIGQYAHGNEPSHHITYLYNYVGRPDKTQSLVKKILNEFYKNAPDGLIGNEDCGQMSAWYVLSAMGLYPVNPCGWAIKTDPTFFKSVKLDMDYFSNSVITSMSTFNESVGYSFIDNACEIVHNQTEDKFYATPFVDFVGKNKEYEPANYLIVTQPYVYKGERLFRDSIVVEIHSRGGEIAYTTDGSDPIMYWRNKSFPQIRVISPYEKIKLKETTTIKFAAIEDPFNERKFSKISTATFKKITKDKTIVLKNQPSPQYSGSSNDVLIDGEYGNEHWQLGGWQGFEGVDLEAVVDLKEETSFNRLILNCVEDQNAWIFSPSEILFYGSNDGKEFKLLSSQKPIVKDTEGAHIRRLGVDVKGKARYIKVVAKPMNPIPSWHKGAGGKGWIFADEIIVE